MPEEKRDIDLRRTGLLEEVTRRIELMDDEEVETEFAAIENCLEVRVRFIPEPL